MLDASQMTPSQLRALADKKEEELVSRRRNTVEKTGFLKCDLYFPHYFPSNGLSDKYGSHLKTIEDKTAFIKSMDDGFKLTFSKDTHFSCYINVYGDEIWRPTLSPTFGSLNGGWAKKYLENITAVES